MEDDFRPLKERERHPVLYYEDGNIILATSTTLFKVYRGILSRNSLVFQDMFSLPQPDSNEGLGRFDDVDVVHLHDDPESLAYFLSALIDKFYYDYTKETEYVAVAAILRLSHKYQVQALREQAISQITTLYPNTLEGLEDFMNGKQIVMNEDDVDAVLLAHEAEVPSLLPSAFYWISSDWDNLVSEIAPQDTGNTTEGELAGYNKLSNGDIVRIACGRDKLRKAFHEEIVKYMYGPSTEGCIDTRGCKNCKGLVVRSDKWRELQWSAGVTGDIRDYMNDLCSACNHALKLTMKEGRRKAWQKLPEYFGLKDWESLLAGIV